YLTIYSGMEVDRFINPQWQRSEVRGELRFHEEDFIVGTVARLAEDKGHDDLRDALEPVVRNHANVRLTRVGEGCWRERLLERVRTMGLQDRVVTTGLVPPEHIPKYMQAMDVLVHPSYREGLPRTVTQALLSA